MRFLAFILLFTIMFSNVYYYRATASESQTIETYAQSDQEIENFLREFIRRSVDNIVFFWSFIIKLVRNIMGDPNSDRWPND